MVNERLQVNNLDQRIVEWMEDTSKLKDLFGRYSDYLLTQVNQGSAEMERSLWQVQKEILDLEHMMVSVGMLMDIRNYTARCAEQLESGTIDVRL